MTKLTGNSGGLNIPKSGISGAVTLTQAQHYFVLEQSFTQSGRYSFGAGETKYFLIDPTGYVPDADQKFEKIIIEVPSFFAAAGPLEVNFYRDPTIAPAVPAALSPGGFNRMASSIRTPDLALSLLDVAPGSVGALFSEILIPASATGGGQKIGFSVGETLPFGLDLTKLVLMSVKNNDGADTLVGIRFNWFEI